MSRERVNKRQLIITVDKLITLLISNNTHVKDLKFERVFEEEKLDALGLKWLSDSLQNKHKMSPYGLWECCHCDEDRIGAA